MQPNLFGLLGRLATAERSFSYPDDEMVQDLYELQARGWPRNVTALKDYQVPFDRWYTASAVMTEEGRSALQQERRLIDPAR